MGETPSLLEVLIAKGGVIKGARVAAFIVQWAVAADELPDPDVPSVARYWAENERTLWRRLADFRELLPELGEHATPQVLVPHLQKNTEKLTRRANMGILGRIAAPAGLVTAA